MLATAPHLLIRRPSPTTAEFTVTTLRPLPLPLHILLLLTRLILTLLTLLLLFAKLTLSPYFPPPEPTTLLHTYHHTDVAALLRNLAVGTPLPVLLPTSAALLWILSRRGYSCESLLVLRGLGVQTSESAGSYLATTATRFIPTEKIQDIFVNEAFRGFEVRYYLVVVVEGEEDVVVVFPGLLPRRKIVEEVWRGVRGCLYEGRMEEKN
ncbi:Fc.00g029020.m01.CDS01 [Cosmosporella sp. VM-42]